MILVVNWTYREQLSLIQVTMHVIHLKNCWKIINDKYRPMPQSSVLENISQFLNSRLRILNELILINRTAQALTDHLSRSSRVSDFHSNQFNCLTYKTKPHVKVVSIDTSNTFSSSWDLRSSRKRRYLL